MATERDKCRRFEEGLWYEIRTRITPVDLESFTRLLTAAIRIERLRVEGPPVPKREREIFRLRTRVVPGGVLFREHLSHLVLGAVHRAFRGVLRLGHREVGSLIRSAQVVARAS